jgi:hypothetical protein
MRYFSFVTKFSFFAALALAFWYTAHPTQVEAASTVKSPIEVYGWIPYWRTATGTADAMQHLSTFTQLSPFGFTLKSDGTLFDAANLTQEPWTSLIAAAKKKKIKIIPTVMNGDGHFMHAILSDPKRRVALEDEIAAMVKERG